MHRSTRTSHILPICNEMQFMRKMKQVYNSKCDTPTISMEKKINDKNNIDGEFVMVLLN